MNTMIHIGSYTWSANKWINENTYYITWVLSNPFLNFLSSILCIPLSTFWTFIYSYMGHPLLDYLVHIPHEFMKMSLLSP